MARNDVDEAINNRIIPEENVPKQEQIRKNINIKIVKK